MTGGRTSDCGSLRELVAFRARARRAGGDLVLTLGNQPIPGLGRLTLTGTGEDRLTPAHASNYLAGVVAQLPQPH
jgi:hypothetical protein